MPFKSKAQAKWMFANKPKMATEWEDTTKSIKALPNKVKGKKNARRRKTTKYVWGK